MSAQSPVFNANYRRASGDEAASVSKPAVRASAPESYAASEDDDYERASYAPASGHLFANAPDDLIEAKRAHASDSPSRKAVFERYGLDDRGRPVLHNPLSALVMQGIVGVSTAVATRCVSWWSRGAKAKGARLLSRASWAARIAAMGLGAFAPGLVPSPLASIGFAVARLPNQPGAFADHGLELTAALINGLIHVFLVGVVLYFGVWTFMALGKGKPRPQYRSVEAGATAHKANLIGNLAATFFEALALYAMAATIASAI